MSPPPLPYSRSTVITRMAINRSLTFPLRIPAFESLSRGACHFYHFYKTACISGLQRSSSNSDFPSGSRLIPFQRKGQTKHNRCAQRSEEHTSELQSRFDLVCRLLLEKKKKNSKSIMYIHIYNIQ